MAEEVYIAVSSGSPEDKARAITALRTTGASDEEAETIYATAAKIAEGAGSLESFRAVLKGEAEVPADLSEDEVAAFGMPGGASAGGASVGFSRKDWGRTWEGSEPIAAPGRPSSSGRTWEGSSNRGGGSA